MAIQYSLLLCLALASLASLCVHSAEIDYSELDYKLDKKALETLVTTYTKEVNGQAVGKATTTASASQFATTNQFATTKNTTKAPKAPKAPKQSPSPPPPVQGGGGGGGGSITVGGGGSFSNIQDAINAASPGSTITINGGRYYQKVVIPSSKRGLKLIGSGNPVISFGLSAGRAGTLAKSASVSVFADSFYASGITFDNDFGFPNGKNGGQAVALMADANGVVFEGCTFTGHQDTLYALGGSQTYRNCKIVGSVDFIFGNAKAKFISCSMQAITNANNKYSAIAAQRRTSAGQNTGFAFIGGSVSGSGKTWLGRTWGSYCTIIYSGTSISGANPLGWTTMSNSNFKNTARVGCTDCSTNGWVSWALSTAAASAELSNLQ